MKKALLMLTGALAAVGLASAFGLGTAQVAPAAPVAETAPAPLYITGDGVFPSGETWNAETPDEFEYVDGNYVITVDELSQFKISTTCGDWTTFNEGALYCDYGTEPGVEVALLLGDANIKCPAKANWTVTVAGDLSTIKLTTEGEVVIVPIEDTPIYLRGDMNSWTANEDWKLTKLGKDSEGAWVYSYEIPENSTIMAGETFKIADETWAKINIGGGYGEPIMLDAETEVFNGGNPANLSVEEDVTGVVYLKMNFTDNLGLIYLTNDKEAPCPFPYEGYVAPEPTPGPEPGGDHLYITGDGDFENGAWEVATPAEFDLVDGNYVITVDNLSQFKISTGYGDWDTFNAYALTCDYGTEQGVEVVLVQGDANIMCPVKATWTITVSQDLSTIKLTTDDPVVVVPVEDESIYLRGDMNAWTADETWKFTKLGKDSEGVVYAYACGLTGITAGDAFKIADADWARINFGGEYTDLIALENETQLAAGSNYNLMAEEDVTGKVYVKLNFTDNTGLIYLTNDKEAPCPFPYEGYVAPEPEPEPVIGTPIEKIEDICGTYGITKNWWWPFDSDKPADPYFTISHMEDNIIAISCSWIEVADFGEGSVDVAPIRASVDLEAGTITISTADNKNLAYVAYFDENLKLDLNKIIWNEDGTGKAHPVQQITVPVLESGEIDFSSAVMLWGVSEGYYLGVGAFRMIPGYEPNPGPQPTGHLYITGDGDFEGGTWNPEEPAEFELVDGNYVITVDNLSTFMISTAFGDWDLFLADALTCDYGSEQGVEVALVQGGDNIVCPVKATWTITVAEDLSTIKLTTDDPVVVVPIEDTPIYLRGDMNSWAADEDWQLTKLGKDSEGAWVYSYEIGETFIVGGESFKFADADWSKINIGGNGELIMLDTETEVFNGGNPANMAAEEDVTGVVYLKLNFTNGEYYIYLTNDKEAPCPFPYEGYVPPTPEPSVDHLYITGDGDFENGTWDPVTPSELEFVDGKYVITVDNLSTFKLSTACGDWDAFNAAALYCDYGNEPGVKVALTAGDANILCPVKAKWTVTVAADLSTVMLTTDQPIVITPIEELPIYLRGDMNGWAASDDWKMTLLGKAADGTAVYSYTCGDTGIAAKDSFKIAVDDWSKINIGAAEEALGMEVVTYAVNGGNPQNFVAPEEITGVIYLQMNYNTNEGAVFVSNINAYPCPFDYEGRPEAGPVKVSVSVSDGTAFGYTTKFGEETQFDVSVADEYWKFVSFTLNGTEQQLAEPAPIVSLSFPAAFINNYVFTAEYAGTLEVVEHSGVVELSNKLTVTVADDTVEIAGLQAGTQVAVYTLGGQTIMTRVAADEVMSIRLDKGQTYIVRAGDAAVKVIL